MAGDNKASSVLSNAIRDGSFPDSQEILSSELSSSTIPQLLKDISRDKEELSHEIQQVSKSLGGGIDEWISKAKRVQDDIARCKEEARVIVEQHARVDAQRADARELGQKSDLLRAEIDFTASLQDQLQSIATISKSLREIEDFLSRQQAPQAAKALQDIRDPVSKIRGPQVFAIVREYETELTARTRQQLESALYSSILIAREPEWCSIAINKFSPEDTLDQILSALSHLDVLEESVQSLAAKIELVILHSLRSRSRLRVFKHLAKDTRFEIHLGPDNPSISELIKFTTDFWDFLRSQLPSEIVASLANTLLPKMIGTLITDWMTPAIPIQYQDLDQLDTLQQTASGLANYLESNHWPGAVDISEWIEQAPRIWLTKRKAETLDAVRNAFVTSRGLLQQVERTERQNAKAEPSRNAPENPEDDWNTSWDDDKPQSDKQGEEEEDASGWGFDDDEPPSPERTRQNPNGNEQSHEEDGDAWGWGDEDPDQPPNSDTKPQQSGKINGANTQSQGSQEIVLTELYSITDIPDHLIEVIGRDVQDSLTLAEEQHISLQSVAPSKGLLSLPTFALAMFRATAPTHYSNSSKLGNMNLYNDASYIAEKLRSMNAPKDMPSIEQDCKAMEKFGRSAYAREMDVQRTILTDLLDGAQGFAGCTQPIYAREIENAVASTVDRVRQVYREWKPILSTSALLQSIGILVTLVINKVIVDIEEMEEISAPQSEKLVAYCGQISALEDLFLAKPPGIDEGEDESVPMTAVYVSNWLKFQYLINILDSSLVDIKFLWTEGELSLEFSQEELQDLIEALFQESPHRRSAIAAIKGHRGSGGR